MPSTFDIHFIITGIRMDLESSLKLDKESLESSLERERERLEAEMEEESERREETWQRQREELLQEIQSERNALSKDVFYVSPCLNDQGFSMSQHIQQAQWNEILVAPSLMFIYVKFGAMRILLHCTC